MRDETHYQQIDRLTESRGIYTESPDQTEPPSLTVAMIFRLLTRALRLRCARCGKGKLFSHGFQMYERCSYCGWPFEREEGYWTGAMGINLVVTESVVAIGVIPPAIMQAPVLPLLAIGIGAAILLPILLYRHSKSFWMALDFMLHPVRLL
jgi:uncharacterized protein (DUF983 family)